jgi:hypothetical protein
LGFRGGFAVRFQGHLGPFQVVTMNPDLGAHARHIADTDVEVIADDPRTDTFLVKSLLPDVGLGRVECERQMDNVIVVHGSPS